jgi:hypothetical protein
MVEEDTSEMISTYDQYIPRDGKRKNHDARLGCLRGAQSRQVFQSL